MGCFEIESEVGEMEGVVMEALSSRHTEVQIQGAMQLSSLTSQQKHKLVEMGIFHPLLAMLNSQDLQATHVAVLAFLALAYGSERNKIKIAKCGAIPILLMILQCQHSMALTEVVIAALFILSSCTRNRLAIVSSGAIPILIDILGGKGIGIGVSVQAKLDAMATLLNLSSCDQIILSSFVSSGLHISLLHTVYNTEKSSDLVEKATALIEKIVSSSEIALQRTAAMDGAIQALVETIEEGSPLSKEHAVGILLQICQSSRDEYRALFLREGVMPGLLQLSVDGTWRAKNQAQTLLLLLRDVSGNRSEDNQLKNEILESIMARIDADDDGFYPSSLSLVEQMIARLSA